MPDQYALQVIAEQITNGYTSGITGTYSWNIEIENISEDEEPIE